MERLADELASLNPRLSIVRSDQTAELERLSRDYYDYSPVLRPLFRDQRAQLAVKATSVADVQVVAGACARAAIPLTVRGAGTGNYGQCVPLRGGVVLELTGLKCLRHLEPTSGVIEVEAGALMGAVDQQLAQHGRALRLVPSTVRTASIGGFIAGGSGGIGSLRWGFLRDPGNLLGLEVVTVEPEPRVLHLDAQASTPLNHAYGCNGILTALRLPTSEAVDWQQVVVGYPSWPLAVDAARHLGTTALLLNALSLLEAPIAAHSPWPTGCPSATGEHRLLLLAAPDSLEVLPAVVAAHRGEILWQAPQNGSRGLPLRELCWNHTTLHWRAHHPDWTYLQLLLPEPEAPFLQALRHTWGEEDLLWHLEGVRQAGSMRLAGLPLIRWRGEDSLQQLIAQMREGGAMIFNPHVFTVEDGGLGVIDADQVAAKASYDPAGLLNPGKLRGWLERLSRNQG